MAAWLSPGGAFSAGTCWRGGGRGGRAAAQQPEAGPSRHQKGPKPRSTPAICLYSDQHVRPEEASPVDAHAAILYGYLPACCWASWPITGRTIVLPW